MSAGQTLFNTFGAHSFSAPANLVSQSVLVTVFGGSAFPASGVDPIYGAFVTGSIPVSQLPISCYVGAGALKPATGAINGAAGFTGGGSPGGIATGSGVVAYGGGGSSAVLSSAGTGTTLLIEAGGADGFSDPTFGPPAGSGGGYASNTPPVPAPPSGSTFGGAGSGGSAGGNGGTGVSAPAGSGGGQGAVAAGAYPAYTGAHVNGNNGSGTSASGAGVGSGTMTVPGRAVSYAAGIVGGVSYGAAGDIPQILIQYRTADAPPAPTPLSPVAGAYVDTLDIPVSFVGTYLAPSGDTGSLELVVLKLIDTTTSQTWYWNGTSLQPTTVQVVPTTGVGAANNQPFSVVIPAGVLTSGHNWTYAFETVESLASLASPFTAAVGFIAGTPATAVFTSPTATPNSTTPTVAWTASGGAGSQTAYTFKLFTAPQASPGTAPALLTKSGTTAATFTFAAGDNLLSGTTYYGYLQVTLTVLSAWIPIVFTVESLLLATPTLTVVSGGNDPTTGMPAPLLEMAAANILNVLPFGAAGFEGLALGAYPGPWSAPVNGTLAIDNAWSAEGTQSLKFTSAGAGACQVNYAPGGFPPLIGAPIPVSPGDSLAVWLTVQQPSLTQSMSLSVEFYGLSGFVSQPVVHTAAASAGGVSLFGNVTVPAGALYVTVISLQFTATGASQITRIDKTGVAYSGTSGSWSSPVGAGVYLSEFQSSLDGGLTWVDILADLVSPLSSSLMQASVTANIYDTGAPFNAPVLYRVRNLYKATSGQTFYSAWSATAGPVTTSSVNWWLLTPSNLDLALGLHRIRAVVGTSSSGASSTPALPPGTAASLVVDKEEQQGVFRPLGSSTATVVRGQMLAEEFDLSVYFENSDEFDLFNAIRDLQETVMLKSDMEGMTYWVALGAGRPASIISESQRHSVPKRGLSIHCTPVAQP